MAVRSGLLEYRTTNAALGWLVVGILLVAAAEHALSGRLLWSGLAVTVVVVALVPPALSRRPAEMIAWEVLALAALPVVVRSFDVLVGPASSLAVAALALVVAAELDAFTAVEMTPGFAVAFVVVVTTALAGLWTVAAFASDVYLGTSLLGDQTEVMWDIVAATGVGVVVGAVFEFYVRRRSPGRDLDRESWGELLPEDGKRSAEDGERSASEGSSPVTPADAVAPDSTLGLVARGMQVAIVGLVGYAVVAGNYGLAINGVLALAVSFIPALLAWRYDHAVDPRLDVWIAVAALVHTVGFLGLYEIQSGPLAYFDQVAHAISASFVAGVGYALVVALDRSSSRVRFPEGFRFVFTVLFIMAFGVGWEIVEFAVSGLGSALGGGAPLVQYGKDDIVLDILFNSLAGVAVGLWGTRYFRDVTDIVSSRVLRRG